MKLLITNFYSKNNKGDAAILSVMLLELKNVFPGAEMTIVTMDKISNGEKFEGVEQINSILFHAIYSRTSMIFRVFYSVFLIVITTLWCLICRLFGIKLDALLPRDISYLLNKFTQGDLILPVGGGYITGRNNIKSSVALVLTMHTIFLAKILKKTVIMYPQSIGPFGNFFQESFAKYILNKVDIIFVRESISATVLKRMGVFRPRILNARDPAFSFRSDKKEKMKRHLSVLGVDFRKSLVGLTSREWLNLEDQKKFESQIASFADYLISEIGMQVIFIPQVTDLFHKDDDRETHRNIARLMKNKNKALLLEENYSAEEIKGIYENLDFLVGTRMHSCIFALTGYVPTIAIEYVHKSGGIMKDLGLEEWVLGMENVNIENLESKFQSLLNNSDLYKKKLKELFFHEIRENEVVKLLKNYAY